MPKGMFLSTSPKSSLGRRSHRALGVAVAALLLAGGGAWYQLDVRATRAPSFSRGGRFVTAGVAARTGPTTTVTTDPRSAASALRPTAPVTAPANSYAPSHLTAVAAAASPQPRSVAPAAGTYEWHVIGSESATGFGSRTLPATMTMVAHAGDGADVGHVVLDLTYSQDHQERLIVGDDAGSLAATYEAGQIRFGPMAQANSGSYRPSIVYVPADLHAGAVTIGTSQVLDGDSVERVEDWKVTVVQRSTIPVQGTPTSVWEIVLERTSRPGSGQQVHRIRREWWDPNRNAVVRFRDTMHGEQPYGGITFTYDEDLTADLVRFTP